MYTFWKGFLERDSEYFVACRFGDDLGFIDSLLTNPKTFLNHIIPQYKRVINLIHSFNKPFLWHSCGNIFRIMDDVIDCGINAKHSNEDIIAPYEKWIETYNDRIALVGGFDLDLLCSKTEQEIYDIVLEKGIKYRNMAKGYALGSGNSIPEYVPVENYLAMLRAADTIRGIN
jgi:uroporphyrinogen decarboxylase